MRYQSLPIQASQIEILRDEMESQGLDTNLQICELTDLGNRWLLRSSQKFYNQSIYMTCTKNWTGLVLSDESGMVRDQTPPTGMVNIGDRLWQIGDPLSDSEVARCVQLDIVEGIIKLNNVLYLNVRTYTYKGEVIDFRDEEDVNCLDRRLNVHGFAMDVMGGGFKTGTVEVLVDLFSKDGIKIKYTTRYKGNQRIFIPNLYRLAEKLTLPSQRELDVWKETFFRDLDRLGYHSSEKTYNGDCYDSIQDFLKNTLMSIREEDMKDSGKRLEIRDHAYMPISDSIHAVIFGANTQKILGRRMTPDQRSRLNNVIEHCLTLILEGNTRPDRIAEEITLRFQ